jgi:2,3-bisphosphoglycerate-independent phosphoglycerate mutase
MIMPFRTSYVICIPDGCADEPVPALGGRTPLAVAPMPTLRYLARQGLLGRTLTIPDGLPACSSVGNMAILGYDPVLFHTGRAPLEAAALGIDISSGQVAFRANFVTLARDGTMLDFTGGRPPQHEAARVIALLNDRLGGEITFHVGQTFRHIMTCPLDLADAICVPPHDLFGRKATPPTGVGGDRLSEIMRASRAVLATTPLAATQIWLWGQGRPPKLPSFTTQHGITGALISAVGVVRGLGTLTGMDVIDVPGATGWYDTDYAAKRDAALNALAKDADLAVIHIEATDEAGHAGDVAEKIRSLAAWDQIVLRGLIDRLDRIGSWRLLLLPDHATPLGRRTHTRMPVPYLMYDSRRELGGGEYSELATADLPVEPAYQLIGRLINSNFSS